MVGQFKGIHAHLVFSRIVVLEVKVLPASGSKCKQCKRLPTKVSPDTSFCSLYNSGEVWGLLQKRQIIRSLINLYLESADTSGRCWCNNIKYIGQFQSFVTAIPCWYTCTDQTSKVSRQSYRYTNSKSCSPWSLSWLSAMVIQNFVQFTVQTLSLLHSHKTHCASHSILPSSPSSLIFVFYLFDSSVCLHFINGVCVCFEWAGVLEVRQLPAT